MIVLNELSQALGDEVGKAETRVLQRVQASFPRAKEDDITTLFVAEAERGFEDATRNGVIASAVRTDLQNAYQSHGRVPPQQIARVSDGIVARLRKHSPSEEAKTGGDFGLLLVEPRFDLRWDAQLALHRCGLKRGLLVQAKRRLRGGHWNQLTATQLKRLPARMDYAALLRYEFADAGDRQLNSFAWHPLSGLSISAVAEWLRCGNFPAAISSPAVVSAVSRGEFGTADQSAIEREICPETGPFVVIEVDWRDGDDPDTTIDSLNREISEHGRRQEQQVHLELG